MIVVLSSLSAKPYLVSEAKSDADGIGMDMFNVGKPGEVLSDFICLALLGFDLRSMVMSLCCIHLWNNNNNIKNNNEQCLHNNSWLVYLACQWS